MERIAIVDNSRQEGMLQELNTGFDSEHHIVIGCGGIGFYTAIYLALLGARDIVLMDGQKIDNTNLSRLPVPQTWIGQNKAVALRKLLRSMRPDIICTIFTTHITEDTLNLLQQFCVRRNNTNYYTTHSTVWDTTDNASIQNKINEYVSNLNGTRNTTVHYRKIGYEGFKVGSYAEYQVWTPTEYETGYRTTQANAVSSALAAGIGVFSRYLTDRDVNVDLKQLIQEGGTVCRTTRKKKSGTRATTAT